MDFNYIDEINNILDKLEYEIEELMPSWLECDKAEDEVQQCIYSMEATNNQIDYDYSRESYEKAVEEKEYLENKIAYLKMVKSKIEEIRKW